MSASCQGFRDDSAGTTVSVRRSRRRSTVSGDGTPMQALGQPPVQLVDPGDRLAAKREDDVAVLHTGRRRRAARFDRRDQDAGRHRELMGARECPGIGAFCPATPM